MYSEGKKFQKPRRNPPDLTGLEVGETYEGKVVSVVPFGVFVEIQPGKQGLCHISQLDHKRIDSIHDYIKVGETIKVKLININEKGQLVLSRKELINKPDNQF